MTNYTAVVDGEAGGYGAWFPDLPGCAATGATFDELILNAADAMRDWAEVATAKGRSLLVPQPIEILKTDVEVGRAIREGAHMRDVPLNLTTGKPVKANLSLDAGVLAAIDAEARRRGLTRSALVEWLARIKLPRTVY